MPGSARKSSSVARRIHLSFLAAAALPLLLLTIVSYYMVSQQLQERALREAHELAKGIGMSVYDRLKFVNDELRIFQDLPVPSQHDSLPKVAGLDLESRTHGLFRVSPDGGFTGELHIGEEGRALLLRQLAQADPGKPLLVMTGAATTRRFFMLVAGTDQWNHETWLGAELNTEYLWDTVDAAVRPERVCILGPEKFPVFCNHAEPDEWVAESGDLVEDRGRPKALLLDSRAPLLTAAWSLFLKPRYQFERWTVLVGIPRSTALASIQAFDRIFAGAVVISLLLAFTLGRQLIKGNLRPLTKLSVATRELAQGRFAHRVQLDSDDEFQQLGDAFNGMASQIGRQFDELEALARMDRSLQVAESLPEAIEAAASALTGLIGTGRCALICHEHWEASNTLWYLPFAADSVSQTDRTPKQELSGVHRSGTLASLTAELPYIRFLGDAPSGAVHLSPVVHDRYVEAEVLISSPQPEAAAVVGRVADVLSTTLTKLVLEQRLRFQARHDWLTGLPNRLHMQGLFQNWAEQAQLPGSTIGMLIMNLDRFKQVNDAHGHAQGDNLLTDVAGRLSNILPPNCVLSRFGGDEFVIMCRAPDQYKMIPMITGLSRQIGTVLDQPYTIAHRTVSLSASMGAALFPRDGDSFDAMLQNMDAALRVAKSSKPGELLMFSGEMRDALIGRMDLEQALKGAVSNNELVLHYQPIVDACSRKVVSAEALMRWQRPGVGLVMPGGFIEVAENSGLIVDFGTWALTEVCRQLQAWRQSGYSIEYISVNVSGKQLADQDFEDGVQEALQESGLDPQHLVLEVTETALIGQFEEGAARLGRLRELGVKIMVDDFGTGYASFKYLKMLPVDGLKIDRMFVKDLPESARDAAIVASLVSLAAANDFKLVAEGIETEEQSRFLADSGVRNFQGFLFDRGLPADEFEQRLRNERDDHMDGVISATP